MKRVKVGRSFYSELLFPTIYITSQEVKHSLMCRGLDVHPSFSLTHLHLGEVGEVSR